MTYEQKLQYMDIATGICHMGFKKKDLDLLVSLYDLVLEKKGEANLKDVAKIKADVEDREYNRNNTPLI